MTIILQIAAFIGTLASSFLLVAGAIQLDCSRKPRLQAIYKEKAGREMDVLLTRARGLQKITLGMIIMVVTWALFLFYVFSHGSR